MRKRRGRSGKVLETAKRRRTRLVEAIVEKKYVSGNVGDNKIEIQVTEVVYMFSRSAAD